MYTYLNCHVFFKYLAILSGKYILKNQPPIKINKFEFNKKTKKTENNKNSKNFNAFYIIYFRYYTWYVKGFFFFQIITSGIHWIFRKVRDLGNYLGNPPLLRIYK